MFKKIILITGILSGISASVFAGTEFYVTVKNRSTTEYTIQQKSEQCWKTGITTQAIGAGADKLFKTEVSNSGVCNGMGRNNYFLFFALYPTSNIPNATEFRLSVYSSTGTFRDGQFDLWQWTLPTQDISFGNHNLSANYNPVLSEITITPEGRFVLGPVPVK